MKHLLNHLIQRHVIPVLLLPVVASGMLCFSIFGLPQAVRSSATGDEIILAAMSLLGVVGTVGTAVLVHVIRSQPAAWQVFELGRTAWSVLVTVAWLAGVACGVLMTYEISR
jgi:hypothetical protein